MLHNYTSLAICTLVVNWTLTLLAFVAVIAIFAHRLVGRSTRVGTDDILILVSFLVGTVLVSVSTWSILEEGQGEHQQKASASQLERAAKLCDLMRQVFPSQSLLVAEALWTLVTGLLRIAACLLTRKIFCPLMQAHRAVVTIMALSASLAAASAIQIFLICRPFAAQWDPRVLGSCGDQVLSFMVLETAGIILDVGILVTPALAIMQLQMRMEMKLRLIMIFNIGAIVLVVTGLRMASLRKAVSPDFTYSQSYLSLLSAAGCMTGIICCASPTMWAIVERLWHSLLLRWDLNDTKDMEKDSSKLEESAEPPVRHPRTARMTPRNVRAAKQLNFRPSLELNTESETQSLQGTDNVDTNAIRPINRDVCEGAIALFDYNSGLQGELPVVKGQILWVSGSFGHQNGWLFAQDLKKGESGFVPEYVLLSRTAIASSYVTNGISHHAVSH